MMRISVETVSGHSIEIVVTGRYNPDILDDMQARVTKTLTEILIAEKVKVSPVK